MSETKFTPGPWFIDGQGIGPKSFADDQSYGITMPVAYIEEYDWPENHGANADLIAAAPTMYEVLDWLDCRGGLGLEVHAVISTALAQARGEA